MNVLRILILVMVMPVVRTPLDPTTAHVTLDLKETDLTALVCTVRLMWWTGPIIFHFLIFLSVAFNVCEHPSLVDCHVNADCVDLVGGYECHCTTGYTGNGTQCTG